MERLAATRWAARRLTEIEAQPALAVEGMRKWGFGRIVNISSINGPAQIPVGRLGHDSEIAHIVRFLVGEEAAFVTGSPLRQMAAST